MAGVTKLVDPDLLKARALMMMERRIKGHSPAAIAAEFNVSESTVERELKRAKRLGLLDQYEQQIVEELMPEAIALFKRAMSSKDDVGVARDVFKGLGFLLSPAERAQAAAPADDQSDLEVYIRRTYGEGRERTQFKPRPRAEHAGLPTVSEIPADQSRILEGALVGPEALAPRVGGDGDEGLASDVRGDVGSPTVDA